MISRTKKKTQKYGIQIPRSVEEAYNLDKEMSKLTGKICTFWADAIKLKMDNIRVAFDILEDNKNIEPGRIFLECYMIFDVKWTFGVKLDM